MNNNKFIQFGVLYFLILSLVLFWGCGYLFLFIYEQLIGIPKELDLILYGILGLYSAIAGYFLSWLIYFLTIGKIYKKLGADFSFKHPVLYTSIVIFLLGNILFYLAMLVWSSVK